MAYQFTPGTDLIKPSRSTYKYLAGLKVKRPTTYDEATYNLQPYENFHYRPIWNPDIQIFDESLTKIKCSDWEQFRDPARLYYATYCYDRADVQSRISGQFEACERFGLFEKMDPSFLDTVSEFLPILRHLFFGESVAYMYVGRFAIGTAIEQCATYQSFDLLGMAQLTTKICTELEERNPKILSAGKQKWMEDEKFQKLRALTEQLMVTWDWAEVVVAFNLGLDLILYPLLFEEMTALAIDNQAMGYAVFSQFYWDNYEYERNWASALIQMLIQENQENKATIQGYLDTWMPQIIEAVKPMLPIFAMPEKGRNGEQALHHVLNKHVKPLLVDQLGFELNIVEHA